MVAVNGVEQAIDGICLAAYLKENNYRLECIAVEINEEIVPKKEYDSTILKDGDIVEVVSFVGGG